MQLCYSEALKRLKSTNLTKAALFSSTSTVTTTKTPLSSTSSATMTTVLLLNQWSQCATVVKFTWRPAWPRWLQNPHLAQVATSTPWVTAARQIRSRAAVQMNQRWWHKPRHQARTRSCPQAMTTSQASLALCYPTLLSKISHSMRQL